MSEPTSSATSSPSPADGGPPLPVGAGAGLPLEVTDPIDDDAGDGEHADQSLNATDEGEPDVAHEQSEGDVEPPAPSVPKLPENATPEQIAEYRQLMGIPDFAHDYTFELPTEYEPSEFEQELVGDYLEHALAKHIPASHVKESLEFFYQAQAANEKATRAIDVDKQQEWRGTLESKLGDDYEPALADGEAYLDKVFADDPDGKHELLNFRGPDGGRLGDHPLFVEWVIERARADSGAPREGTPSIQQTPPAGTQQSQQRPASLAAQQEAIERLQWTDKRRYNDPSTQAQLESIIERRVAAGELNWMGEPVRKRKAAQ